MSNDNPSKDPNGWPRKGGKPAHRRFANRVPKPAVGGVREDGNHVLYGVHTVLEALKNPQRSFIRLITTENGAMRLREEGMLPVEPVIVKPEEINRQLSKDAVHQGVLLIAEPLEPLRLADAPVDGLILALDQVTDPHNVGAVLRSACAFGAAGMIVTTRNSPEVTGVLAKAASGALEHVPFIEVRNLAKALAELGERGFQRVGLDSEGDVPLMDVKIRRPLCLVLGAEGKGLRPVTREQCDVVARLPMPGAIASLNVSNAAAVALYAVTTANSTTEGSA
ncbi:MAG: 23S rRNA (guanosine(2251)-2'-O)-methyltransferase RlmB [Beijerinckiaceae bacterium]